MCWLLDSRLSRNPCRSLKGVRDEKLVPNGGRATRRHLIRAHQRNGGLPLAASWRCEIIVSDSFGPPTRSVESRRVSSRISPTSSSSPSSKGDDGEQLAGLVLDAGEVRVRALHAGERGRSVRRRPPAAGRGSGGSAAARGPERRGRGGPAGWRMRWCSGRLADAQRLMRSVSWAHMAISTRFRAPSLAIRLAR